MLDKYDARIRKKFLGQDLEVGHLVYGEARTIWGSYTYRPAEYFLQSDLGVVRWPEEDEPDLAIAHKVCKLLEVSTVWFITADHTVLKFNFVASSALQVT